MDESFSPPFFELGNVPKLVQINYGQSFSNGLLYVGISRSLKDEAGVYKYIPCVITSHRNCIEKPDNNGPDHGFRLRKPPVNVEPRWSEESLCAYLDCNKTVELLDAFSDVYGILSAHCHFEDVRWLDVITLLIVCSYCHQVYPAFPYLQINGLRESGKTTLMEIIAALSFNGILTSSASPAFVFRYVDSLQASICIDELEGLDSSDDSDGVMQRLLNSGYRSSGTVTRASVGKKEGSWEPEVFRAYSFKAFAGIAELPSTLASRCISITMLRSSERSYSQTEFKSEGTLVQSIRDKLYESVMLHASELAQAYDDFTSISLKNRNLQLWRPLLSAAKLIDIELAAEVEKFTLELETDRESLYADRQTVSMLAGLTVFLRKSQAPLQFVPISTLKEVLVSHDEEYFGFLKANKDGAQSSKWVTKQLRQAGVITTAARSGKLGGGGPSVRGHDLNTRVVEDRLRVYSGNVTSVTSVTNKETEYTQSSLPVTKVTEDTVREVYNITSTHHAEELDMNIPF